LRGNIRLPLSNTPTKLQGSSTDPIPKNRAAH
jgi:hypothetical protein